MNWDKEIEIDRDSRASGSIKLADLLDWVLASVTKEESEQLAEQLIRWAELGTQPLDFYK